MQGKRRIASSTNKNSKKSKNKRENNENGKNGKNNKNGKNGKRYRLNYFKFDENTVLILSVFYFALWPVPHMQLCWFT